MSIHSPSFYPALALLSAAKAFDVPDDALNKQNREQPAAFARQVAWWLLSDVCGWGSQMISRLSGREHGTILHAWHAVENRIKCETDARERVVMARGLFVRAIGKVNV